MAGCATNTSYGIDNPNRFSKIDEIPFVYGGDPDRATANEWVVDQPFKNRLNDWLGDLKNFSSDWGSRPPLQRIGTLGMYVQKPGCHGVGQAMDLAWVQWGLGKNATYCKPYTGQHEAKTQTLRRLYLAVDAVTRMTFKYTLDGWYDASHTNHIHMDMHTDPVLKKNLPGDSDSSGYADTVFVQAVCNRFNGASLTISGVWNDATRDAWRAINRKWGYNDDDNLYGTCHPSSDPLHWRAWLALVARHGFADKPAGTYQSGTC
jgi:hypothetical protein